jgi:predicted transcriptional regulator
MFMDKPVTGHLLAKMLTFTFSRATTYRKLNKMEKMGLIRVSSGDAPNGWALTDKGVDLWENYNELPF